jgi:hypothetical protein
MGRVGVGATVLTCSLLVCWTRITSPRGRTARPLESSPIQSSPVQSCCPGCWLAALRAERTADTTWPIVEFSRSSTLWPGQERPHCGAHHRSPTAGALDDTHEHETAGTRICPSRVNRARARWGRRVRKHARFFVHPFRNSNRCTLRDPHAAVPPAGDQLE